jgi:hypothetical protein
VEDNAEASRETWDGTSPISSSNAGARMSHIIQKRLPSLSGAVRRASLSSPLQLGFSKRVIEFGGARL